MDPLGSGDGTDQERSGTELPAVPGLPPDFSVPDHDLLRRIGGGSYGTVWLARNRMGIFRAVKVVYRKSFEHEGPFAREWSGILKFEPVSRSHEGFVDVLHVGTDEQQGCFYYVMELGDDQRSGQTIDPGSYQARTLASEIKGRRRLTAQECLRLGLDLSHALAELHRHGLVHRDIKPSNIIFVNGVPKLADIGLVTELDKARSFVGTEGFIPPEGPGTAQADVYSLGKVLYEAGTGRDRQEFPELPTLLDQLPDCKEFLELNEVILQACQADVARRYQSAWDMHADLLVLANGKSVKRLKELERRWSKVKKVCGVSTLALMIVGVLGFQGYREWRRAMEARQQRVGSHVAFGIQAMESGDRLAALPHFAEAVFLDRRRPDRARAHRLRFGSALAQCPKLEQMWFAGREVNDVSFSPNGEHVLVTEWVGSARLFDLSAGRPAGPNLAFGQSLERAAYSRDGRLVVTASEDHTACVWNASNGEKVLTLPHPDKVLTANFSPDDLRIVTGCKDRMARVWNARTGEIEFTIAPHGDAVLFANFSPDGRYIVTTSRDNTARVWNSTNGLAFGPPLEHPTWPGYAAFDPASEVVVTSCFDHKARIWDVAAERRFLVELRHRAGVSTVEFSPEGRLVLTASLDGTARVWDAHTASADSTLVLRHAAGVTRAAFAPDGHHVVTACVDGTVRVWDLAGTAFAPLCMRSNTCDSGSRFVTRSNDTFQVFDTLSGKAASGALPGIPPLEKVELNGEGSFAVAISSTGPGSGGQLVRVWNIDAGLPVASALLIKQPLTGAVLSDGGKFLATYGGKFAQVWDVQAEKALGGPLNHDDAVKTAFFSRDGRQLATISGTTVRVWNTSTGGAAYPPLKHAAPVTYAEFSPNSRLLVTCCADDQFNACDAQVWNAATGEPVGPPLKHFDGVLRAAFSPDSRRVATAGEDFNAFIWEIPSGRKLAAGLRHDNHVQALAFSPDGAWIATASPDLTARLWSVDTGEPLTPSLRLLAKPPNIRFLQQGTRIATFDRSTAATIWDLPVDTRPVEDLVMLTRLLSGASPDLPDLPVPGSTAPAATETAWRRLREKYPNDFIASDAEIVAWHELAAQQSEAQQQWSAAAFHLERLIAMCPDEPLLGERLARAKAETEGAD